MTNGRALKYTIQKHSTGTVSAIQKDLEVEIEFPNKLSFADNSFEQLMGKDACCGRSCTRLHMSCGSDA